MSILDKLFGHHEQPERRPEQDRAQSFTGPAASENSDLTGLSPEDAQAIARYRYMLRTAPPETIEQAHAEAFAKLTPEQRRIVLDQLSKEVPDSERSHASDDPQSLARMATRAEMREPGIMERLFGGFGGFGAYGGPGMMGGGGPGLGTIIAGSFLGNIAANMVGSMIARHFFSNTDVGQGFFGGQDYERPLFAPSGSRDDEQFTSTTDDDTDTSSDDTDDSTSDDSSDTDSTDYSDDSGDDSGSFDSGSDDMG
jgi:hypothetical protein